MAEHDALTVLRPAALVTGTPCLPAMSDDAIAKVRRLEALSLQIGEEVDFPTSHLIHGGLYARTLHMKAGTYLTGALLKIPTTLIVAGDCMVFIGTEVIELHGYNVLPGSAGRKQVFIALTDLAMTMLFPTTVTTVAEAEQAFTDEYALLMSNYQEVTTTITGE